MSVFQNSGNKLFKSQGSVFQQSYQPKMRDVVAYTEADIQAALSEARAVTPRSPAPKRLAVVRDPGVAAAGQASVESGASSASESTLVPVPPVAQTPLAIASGSSPTNSTCNSAVVEVVDGPRLLRMNLDISAAAEMVDDSDPDDDPTAADDSKARTLPSEHWERQCAPHRAWKKDQFFMRKLGWARACVRRISGLVGQMPKADLSTVSLEMVNNNYRV